MSQKNMSCVRVERITAAGALQNERHNERKNESYANLNVDVERIPLNVHYKSPGDMTYNGYFEKLLSEGRISTRGQKPGATIFNEMLIDVNTRYFEERGGYEYAKKFYEEAYRFCCAVYGEENIVSAVMHADEINKAVSEELGRPVYHYHLHVVAIPTVKKEVKWTKRCKDPALVGTVKEVIQQVSHSKKWKNTVPVLDENGKQVINKYGRPVFRKSYSVLQDDLFEHMRAAGFRGFERGELGSTAEHLSSVEYQLEQDKARLADVRQEVSDTEQELTDAGKRLAETEQRTTAAEAKLTKAEKQLVAVSQKVTEKRKVAITLSELDAIGTKGFTGKYTVSKEELDRLKGLAEEGVHSRGKISTLEQKVERVQRENNSLRSRVANLQDKLDEARENYDRLLAAARPYLTALQRFPETVKAFFERLLPERQQTEERRQPVPEKKPKRKTEWEL